MGLERNAPRRYKTERRRFNSMLGRWFGTSVTATEYKSKFRFPVEDFTKTTDLISPNRTLTKSAGTS
ncbi:MAG: hypothetical protein ACLUKN_12140 [Bacilli bacterium]